MPLPILTIQYLEDSSELASLQISRLIDRLRLAADILPFSHLLIGWHLPQLILDACRLEAERLGLRFLLWLPLLTMDKGISPEVAWQAEGLTGQKVPGYKGLPEFTFICPNHPAAQEGMLMRLASLVRSGIYQGFFLDRVRFPSPSHDPVNDLACFCEHCIRKASESGLDLGGIRKALLEQVRQEQGCRSLVAALLDAKSYPVDDEPNLIARQFISFRQQSISEFLALATRPLHAAQLEIGLDCFSPSLAYMVGQDLSRVGHLVDWVKLMTYMHTYAPAGLPYEVDGLLQFLINSGHLSQQQAVELIVTCTGLPMPATGQELLRDGLPPAALEQELRRGRQATTSPVLAGIELVDLPGVVSLDSRQIQADLTVIRQFAPHGLAISWDLLHIPLDRLKLVAQAYSGRN